MDNNRDGGRPPTTTYVGDDKFTRLDNRSKISLMAAIMYAVSDDLTEEQAVDRALKVDRLVGDKLRQIKLEKDRLRARSFPGMGHDF